MDLIAAPSSSDNVEAPEKSSLLPYLSESSRQPPSNQNGDRASPAVLSPQIGTVEYKPGSPDRLQRSRRGSQKTLAIEGLYEPSADEPNQSDCALINFESEEWMNLSCEPTLDWNFFNYDATDIGTGLGIGPFVAPSATRCSSSRSFAASKIRRRRQPRDTGDDTCDEDTEYRHSKQRKPNSDDHKPKFACPYRKRYPAKYGTYGPSNWSRSCALSHWESVSRVKEHLYRCHMAPPQCGRCGSTFPTSEMLQTHFRSANPCSIRAAKLPDGITPDMFKALKSRKKNSLTDEERWKNIYRVLFPDEYEIPNPYIDSVSDEPSRVLDDFEAYCRTEIPKKFSKLLQEHFPNIEDDTGLKVKLMSAVESCHASVFAEYRSKFGDLSQSNSSTPNSNYVSTPTPVFTSTTLSTARHTLASSEAETDAESKFPPDLDCSRDSAFADQTMWNSVPDFEPPYRFDFDNYMLESFLPLV